MVSFSIYSSSVNDIIAMSSQSFYATNDSYYSNYYLKILEFLLGLSFSNVVYYSPFEVKVVATGYGLLNGIDISVDGK